MSKIISPPTFLYTHAYTPKILLMWRERMVVRENEIIACRRVDLFPFISFKSFTISMSLNGSSFFCVFEEKRNGSQTD